MIASLDTYYDEFRTTTAVVCFGEWQASKPHSEYLVSTPGHPSPYIPGRFLERELPPILNALAILKETIDVLIIDAYVWLDAKKRPGLGARLFEVLDGKIPVVGIAKAQFKDSTALEVRRGKSKKPLFVTSIGIDLDAAVVLSMHGSYRIPTLLKRTDFLSRQGYTTQKNGSILNQGMVIEHRISDISEIVN